MSDKEQGFDVPVVLFTFKRADKTLEVLDRISLIKPKKLYILSDEGRDDAERAIVSKLRYDIEAKVTWDCELIKNYASENRGVYENIGVGAKWVFEREPMAIFLEDDNLPELTFFQYCKDLLKLYKEDTRIFWICGTNYLKEYESADGASYLFTANMLPCGWASWSDKFLKFYDGELNLWKDDVVRQRVESLKYDLNLKKQDIYNWDNEAYRISRGDKPSSWDYQMSFSIRANNLFGIVPVYNQIRNIGADLDSTHGGSSLNMEMTKRFCDLQTKPLQFPLKHPKSLILDPIFVESISKIIVLPLKERMLINIGKYIKKVFGLNPNESLLQRFKIK